MMACVRLCLPGNRGPGLQGRGRGYPGSSRVVLQHTLTPRSPPPPALPRTSPARRDLDERDLPVAPPAIEGALAPGSNRGVLVPLEIDQPTHPVALGDALAHALAVLPRTPCAIARHADVEHAARATGHDVDPVELAQPLVHGARRSKSGGEDPGSARPGLDRGSSPGASAGDARGEVSLYSGDPRAASAHARVPSPSNVSQNRNGWRLSYGLGALEPDAPIETLADRRGGTEDLIFAVPAAQAGSQAVP